MPYAILCQECYIVQLYWQICTLPESKWYLQNNWVCKQELTICAANYYITELDFLGSCANMSQFKHLLLKEDIVCKVDHLALTYIMKVKLKQPVQESKDC